MPSLKTGTAKGRPIGLHKEAKEVGERSSPKEEREQEEKLNPRAVRQEKCQPSLLNYCVRRLKI